MRMVPPSSLPDFPVALIWWRRFLFSLLFAGIFLGSLRLGLRGSRPPGSGGVPFSSLLSSDEDPGGGGGSGGPFPPELLEEVPGRRNASGDPFSSELSERVPLGRNGLGGGGLFTLDLLLPGGSGSLIDFFFCTKLNRAPCTGVREHKGYPDTCAYVANTNECKSQGFLDYTIFFYCTCGKSAAVGSLALVAWLLLLFYVLGNTSADYFCCSLRRLSSLMHLSPGVAGVTLLALGNGAPDVFASMAAFMNARNRLGDGGSSLGLSGVLGGSLFVTTVVSGSVSIASHRWGGVQLEWQNFVRDVGFLLLSMGVLCLIIYDGKIFLPEAVAFLSLYIVYTASVAIVEVCRRRGLPLSNDSQSSNSHLPLLAAEKDERDEEDGNYILPWKTPSVTLYSHVSREAVPLTFDRDASEPKLEAGRSQAGHYLGLFYMYAFEYPLAIPRRLTIPVVEPERWDRPTAIASACLAPLLLTFVLVGGGGGQIIEWGVALVSAVLLGLVAFFGTSKDQPPLRLVSVWVAGGFLMSVIWFYLISRELVAVLMSMGTVFDVDPALLALTVLSWGNSISDLVADLYLALESQFGTQAAISGCYAAPMFNNVVGLGMCLFYASWNSHPSPFLLPNDSSIVLTIGFLVIGLAWALIIIPSRGMKLSKTFGVVLICIYGCFLLTILSKELGLVF